MYKLIDINVRAFWIAVYRTLKQSWRQYSGRGRRAGWVWAGKLKRLFLKKRSMKNVLNHLPVFPLLSRSWLYLYLFWDILSKLPVVLYRPECKLSMLCVLWTTRARNGVSGSQNSWPLIFSALQWSVKQHFLPAWHIFTWTLEWETFFASALTTHLAIHLRGQDRGAYRASANVVFIFSFVATSVITNDVNHTWQWGHETSWIK